METCPHGARIVLVDGKQPVFLDDCESCANVLADFGVESVYRAPISAAS